MTKLLKVEYVRSNEINDIFKKTFANGEVDYITFPRTMEMKIEDLND